jgi:hypothetical protein
MAIVFLTLLLCVLAVEARVFGDLKNQASLLALLTLTRFCSDIKENLAYATYFRLWRISRGDLQPRIHHH